MNNNINKYDSLGYFECLEAFPDSTIDSISQNYRNLAKKWHPDHNADIKAIDKFQNLSAAYNLLKSTSQKLKYILLSMIYDKQNFPDITSLCLIRDLNGNDDINIRAIKLSKNTGNFLKLKKCEKIYYCKYAEAFQTIKNTSKHNWCYGFLSIFGFFANIKSIIRNITNINNKRDNLQLLIHNAIVYNDLGHYNEALTLAVLSKDYASKEQLIYINQFIAKLENASIIKTTKWNFNKLKKIQLIFPLYILIIICAAIIIMFAKNYEYEKNSKINLKEVVRFKDGQQTFSDVTVASIFDVPINIYDDSKLYFVTKDSKAMHGADYGFDLYKNIKKGTTVRITGYTVDYKWYRVMFDNGDNAFIEAKNLKQGIGTAIPFSSKIYKKN